MTLVGCDLHTRKQLRFLREGRTRLLDFRCRRASTATASGHPRAAQRTESMAAVRHKRRSIACQHPPA